MKVKILSKPRQFDLYKKALLALLSFALLYTPNLEAGPRKDFVIGIFPRYNYTDSIKMFSPLADYLSKKLKTHVVVETSRNYHDFLINVANNKYDVIHVNQYQLLIAQSKYKYRTIIKNEENGSSDIKSLILVRKDSNITTLADLKGKKIIFGGNNTAMMSYLVPKAMLLKAGLNSADYKSFFALNPPNALVALALGKADACGVGDSLLKFDNLKNHLDLENFEIIAESIYFPHLAWAVSPNMSSKKEKKIQKYFLELNRESSGKYILNHAKLSGFREAKYSEYEHLIEYFDGL